MSLEKELASLWEEEIIGESHLVVARDYTYFQRLCRFLVLRAASRGRRSGHK